MALLLVSLVLLFIFSGVQALQASNITRSWPREELDKATYDSNSYFLVLGNKNSVDNHNVSYIICNFSANCTVGIYSTTEDDEISSKTCNTQLPMSKNSQPIIFRLQQLKNGNKFALSWTSIDPLTYLTAVIHISILNISDCTIIHPVRFNKTKAVGPVLHEGGFEIFAISEQLCVKGVPRCRLSFNENGQWVGEPQAFPLDVKDSRLWTVAADSAAKGFFVNGYSDRGKIFKVHLVDSSGELINLVEDIKESESVGWRDSNAHELYGVCWIHAFEQVNCAQYDAAGMMKMHIKMRNFFNHGDFVSVYNLKGGGMLLFNEVWSDKYASLLVRKIYVNGTTTEARELSLQKMIESEIPIFQVDVVETENELIFYVASRNALKLELSVLRTPREDFV